MRRLLIAAAALSALAATAAAAIVLRATPRELADAAAVVAEGRIAAVDVRWDGDRTCINTYVTLTVERVHKGAAPGSLVVKVPGGKVGEDEVRVEGTAKFERDEQVIVFLWKDADGEWQVLGEAQGKFRLWQDAKSGKRMAGNSLKGLCLVVRGGTKDPAAAEAARRPDTLPCEDLCAVVKASVDAARAAADAKAGGKTDPAAGRDPAPPSATPDPPSTTKPPGDGAPPPAKDVPAPRAGASNTPGTGQPPPPAPEKK